MRKVEPKKIQTHCIVFEDSFEGPKYIKFVSTYNFHIEDKKKKQAQEFLQDFLEKYYKRNNTNTKFYTYYQWCEKYTKENFFRFLVIQQDYNDRQIQAVARWIVIGDTSQKEVQEIFKFNKVNFLL